MSSPNFNSQALFGGIEVPERDVIDEIITLYVDFEEVSSSGFEVEGSEEMKMILGAFVNANESSEIQSSSSYAVANTQHIDSEVAPNNDPSPAAPDTATTTRPLQQRNLNINSERRFNFPVIKLKTQSKYKKENPKVKLQAEQSNSVSNQRCAPPPSLYKMLSNGWR